MSIAWIESSGGLEFVSKTTGITNPSYLAFDATQRFLYAVNELKTYEGKPTGTVSAFAVDPRTGRLEFLNRQLTHGTDPCHVARRPAADTRVRRQLHERQRVRTAGALTTAAWEKPRDFIQHQGSSIDPRRQRALMPTRSRSMRRTGSRSFPISGSTS